jgi:hypothetical protein
MMEVFERFQQLNLMHLDLYKTMVLDLFHKQMRLKRNIEIMKKVFEQNITLKKYKEKDLYIHSTLMKIDTMGK